MNIGGKQTLTIVKHLQLSTILPLPEVDAFVEIVGTNIRLRRKSEL